MNWLRLFPLILLGLVNVVLAGLVAVRDHRRLNNLAFAVFALAIGLWSIGIAGFLMSTSYDAAWIWACFYYVMPLFMALSGYCFASTFPSLKLPRSPLLYLAVVGFFGLLAMLLAVPHVMLLKIVYHSWGKEVLLSQTAYVVYALYIVLFFSVILLTMHRKSRKLQGVQARQAELFFLTFSVTAIFGLIFNLILPLFHNYRLIWLGPLFTSISIVGVGYSIVQHKMFDIRLVVARALAYSLSIVVLLGAYSLLFYAAISRLSDHLVGGWKSVVNLVLILIAAVTYGPLKHYFDRLTNRLFYRDAYDPQVFLDELNQALVANLDLNKLLSDAAGVIVSNLKAGWCVFGVKETNFRGIRVIGTSQKSFQPEEIAAVRAITPHLNSNIIVVDNLPPEQAKLKQLLAKNDIALLARLVPSNHKTEEGLGYIVLGAKKSGNPYSTADERIIDIVASELLIAIQNSLHFEEIQNFNLTLQQKVDDATREVKRANERLKQLDETKDDFISMASHQLRTPLTSVKGYLSLILDGDVGRITTQQRKMLQQAYTSSQRMVYLIADLLNVSRLKTGKFAIEPTPINLAEVVDEEMDQLVGAAKGKDLKMTYIKPSTFPTLMLDETKTRQVIMNFVDNAIYYTPPGGTINVKLTETPHAVEFRVIDNGIGVPASERYHLFTKFYRAKNAQKARPDGTGLGLFMAKKVIVGEGGSIIFDSEENKGSTFGFSFSKAKLAAKPPSGNVGPASTKVPSKAEEAIKEPVS